jgi:hypothetical protein
MNGPAIPLSRAGAPHLHARRCARHVTREAAARCPGCGEFFCRECVVEHAGKLLCVACLSRSTAAREKRQHRLAVLRRGASATLGALMLWLVFYWVGVIILKMPPDFHDGTVWKKAVEGPGE